MSRLIDIDDISLRKTIACGGLSAKALWRRIQQQPTIDAVEVVRGEWVETLEGTVCGNCHTFPSDDGEYPVANWYSNYCPNCGARMKGADDE